MSLDFRVACVEMLKTETTDDGHAIGTSIFVIGGCAGMMF
jgi:hypothetical protein